MPSLSSSFSPCSVKLIRNCIPSLYLFSTSRQSTIITPNKWPPELIEVICIEAFHLATYADLEGKQINTNNNQLK